jgi:phage shock protein E
MMRLPVRRALLGLVSCAAVGAACDRAPPEPAPVTPTAAGPVGRSTPAPAAAPLDAAALAREPDAILLDVRTPGEFAGGHLEGAVNIPVGDTARMAETIGRKDRPVLLYCAAGGRSAQALAALKAEGFTRLVNAGGLDAAAAKTGKAIVR